MQCEHSHEFQWYIILGTTQLTVRAEGSMSSIAMWASLEVLSSDKTQVALVEESMQK